MLCVYYVHIYDDIRNSHARTHVDMFWPLHSFLYIHFKSGYVLQLGICILQQSIYK